MYNLYPYNDIFAHLLPDIDSYKVMPARKGRHTRADKMKLSVHLGKILVKKSVEFNTTDTVHSV